MSDTGTVGADGVIEWRDAEGGLDRARGPARVLPGGREEWFRHGRRVWFVEGQKMREERGG